MMIHENSTFDTFPFLEGHGQNNHLFSQSVMDETLPLDHASSWVGLPFLEPIPSPLLHPVNEEGFAFFLSETDHTFRISIMFMY